MAKQNIPQLCALEAFAHTFQYIKMLLVWRVRETGKETDGIANVKLACDAGKDKFPKKPFLETISLVSGIFSAGPLRVNKQLATVGWMGIGTNFHVCLMQERFIHVSGACNQCMTLQLSLTQSQV